MILKDKTVLWVYFFPQNTHFELNENIHHICITDVTVVYITLGQKMLSKTANYFNTRYKRKNL